MQVKRTKLEVGCGNITHQCADNLLVHPFCCQQICPRRFGGTAVLPPKIEIPGQRETHLICASVVLTVSFCELNLLIISANAGTDRRQLVSACNAYLCLGFQDSRCRNANIVILLESSVNQVLKLLILKHLPPFLVSERFRRRLRRRFGIAPR